MDLRSDQRGLAVGLITFFAILIIAALLYTMMDGPITTVFDISTTSAESSGATDQIGVAEAIWNNILYYVLFLAALFLIARAVREGARAG